MPVNANMSKRDSKCSCQTGTSMHLIMASAVLRTLLAKNVHLSKQSNLFISPNFGTVLFHVKHSQCVVLWFNPRNLIPFKLMRIMHVNPGLFAPVTTRQGFPMFRWHRSYLHALACPLTAMSRKKKTCLGALRFAVNTVAICTNEMPSRPSLHWSSISTSSTTSLAAKDKEGSGSHMDLQNI